MFDMAKAGLITFLKMYVFDSKPKRIYRHLNVFVRVQLLKCITEKKSDTLRDLRVIFTCKWFMSLLKTPSGTNRAITPYTLILSLLTAVFHHIQEVLPSVRLLPYTITTKFEDNRTKFRDFGIFGGKSPPPGGGIGGTFGLLKKAFVKWRGTEHKY